jgi:mRNA-degrading endonuclease YafQ of YafQ-DinJ toxin-antitoxin module
MRIDNLLYSSNFLKEAKKLPPEILTIFEKKEILFRFNPLHPSLRLHQLHGELKELWSISLTQSYRAIFKRQSNGDILFISIGKHDIYRSL